MFVETIANPRTQVADLEAIGELCASQSLVYVVDNTMTSPYLFQPNTVGASIVVNALTKYIARSRQRPRRRLTEMGAFRLADASRTSHREYRTGNPQMWGLTQIRKKGLRDFGASLAPEAAHHIAVGAETLALRLERQCAQRADAGGVPRAGSACIDGVLSGTPDHPQHDLAARLFRHPGALFSFELDAAIDVFDFLNRLDVVIKSSNLGDNRTLAIPVAHTIYYEMGAERRASMGIADSLIRISVGIEDTDDLVDRLRTGARTAVSTVTGRTSMDRLNDKVAIITGGAGGIGRAAGATVLRPKAQTFCWSICRKRAEETRARTSAAIA